MPSPFPGMNPYLERAGVWHGFHDALMTMIRFSLVPVVTPRYQVWANENVYVLELSAEERGLPLGRPDVFMTRQSDPATDGGQTIGGVTVAAGHRSRRVVPAIDPYSETTIEIRDADGERVVTAIELLSPTNKKPGDGRQQYMHKRRLYFASRTNLVEIDLLRGGTRPDLEPPVVGCDYAIAVARASDQPNADVFELNLRDPLPTIPIPLRQGDADVTLGLQSLLHEVYDRGGFAGYAYRREPDPPLSPEDAAWARSLLGATPQMPRAGTADAE